LGFESTEWISMAFRVLLLVGHLVEVIRDTPP